MDKDTDNITNLNNFSDLNNIIIINQPNFNESCENNFTLQNLQEFQGTGYFPKDQDPDVKYYNQDHHPDTVKYKTQDYTYNQDNLEISFCNTKLNNTSEKNKGKANSQKVVGFNPVVEIKKKASDKNDNNSFLKKNQPNNTNLNNNKTKCKTTEFSKNNTKYVPTAILPQSSKTTRKPTSSKNIPKLDEERKFPNNISEFDELDECVELTNDKNNKKTIKRSSSTTQVRANANTIKTTKINTNKTNINQNNNTNTNVNTIINEKNKNIGISSINANKRGASAGKTYSNNLQSCTNKNKQNMAINVKVKKEDYKLDINNLIDLCNNPDLANHEPIILEKLDNILDNLTEIKNVIKDNNKKKSSKNNFNYYLDKQKEDTHVKLNVMINDVKANVNAVNSVKSVRTTRNLKSNIKINEH